jgi:hypothetical protein
VGGAGRTADADRQPFGTHEHVDRAVHVSSPGPAATFWAGLGAIRRDAFDAVGGFDEWRC